MNERKQPKKQDPETVLAKNPKDYKGRFKKIGGSECDDWNDTLLLQAGRTIWAKHSDAATVEQQANALLHGMIGIGPQDELEGMMAAQLIAAHNAGMECYRRAMLAEQSFDGRRENLNQANKLSRTFATLPIPSDAERQVPDARRKVSRGSQR